MAASRPTHGVCACVLGETKQPIIDHLKTLLHHATYPKRPVSCIVFTRVSPQRSYLFCMRSSISCL